MEPSTHPRLATSLAPFCTNLTSCKQMTNEENEGHMYLENTHLLDLITIMLFDSDELP